MEDAARVEILHVQGLKFFFPGECVPAVSCSARIGPGVTLLHGDTGSGKSTLLRLIAGELRATEGRLTLAGLDADTAAEDYQRRIFHGDPDTHDFDALTARDCTAALCAGDQAFDAALWSALVDGFSLRPHIDKPVFMLSTGSKRKVWLAAALAARRTVTLLDEPTAALDAGSIRCLWSALAECGPPGGRAVIVASGERSAALPWAGVIELP